MWYDARCRSSETCPHRPRGPVSFKQDRRFNGDESPSFNALRSLPQVWSLLSTCPTQRNCKYFISFDFIKNSQSPLDFHVFIFHVSGISWRVSVCVTIKRCNWLILGNVLHWPQHILYAFGNPPCKRHIEMFSSISHDVFLKMTLNAFFVCLPSRFSKREEEEGKDERIDFHP